MNIPEELLKLAEIFKKSNKEFYLVGGCVRDFLMRLEPHDYDACTNANPNETIRILEENSIYHYEPGLKYGTIIAVLNGNEYEITTYRSDCTYLDGRRPENVVFETDINKDLSRRDFTINAIAYDPLTNTYADPYGGLEDINDGVLRAVGNANERFSEDALRILRAVRFCTKYKMAIDIKTFHGMCNNLDKINLLSKERITEEFRKILSADNQIQHLLLARPELVTDFIPELKPTVNFNQKSKYHLYDVFTHTLHVADNCVITGRNDGFIIRMAALLHDIGKPKSFTMGDDGYGHFYGHPKESYEIAKQVLKEHFRVTTEEYEQILTLVCNHDILIPDNKKTIRRLLCNLGEDTLDRLLVLRDADRKDHINMDLNTIASTERIRELIKEIQEENSAFKISDLAVNGNDVMIALNIRPGKKVGLILNHLLDEVLDNPELNTSDYLLGRIIEIESLY